MELTVRKDDLVKCLSRSQSVVERRTSMPILSNVHMEAQGENLVITATDLETSFQGVCKARVSKPGLNTVPARKFFEMIKELPSEEIYIKEKENHHMHVSAGRTNYDIVGMPPDDYPTLPDVEGIPEVGISGEVLSEMLEKTIFAISQEDTRFNLAGLYVQKRNKDGEEYLRLVSTDGHRLCLVDRKMEGLDEFGLDKGVIIPRKGVSEMKRLAEDGDLSLGLNSNYATVRQESSTLILRMQEGSFPDYEVVIPKNTKRVVTVGRQAFGDVLRRVSIMSVDRFQGVRLIFKEGLLEIMSQNPELGEARESLEVEYLGEEFQVGFNARYFLDLCGAMRSEDITLSFVDENSPCLIKGEGDEGFLSVIMPMRL